MKCIVLKYLIVTQVPRAFSGALVFFSIFSNYFLNIFFSYFSLLLKLHSLSLIIMNEKFIMTKIFVLMNSEKIRFSSISSSRSRSSYLCYFNSRNNQTVSVDLSSIFLNNKVANTTLTTSTTSYAKSAKSINIMYKLTFGQVL